MWRYGRKIIDLILKRRQKRFAVCAELESRCEADSDRRDIRVFEAGLSAQQYGDYEQGTRNAAKEKESARLIAVARANNLYVDKKDWPAFGDRKRLPSGESIVYLDRIGKTVIKIRNPFAKAALKNLHAQDVLYEHLVHNVLFPKTKYRLVGIGEDVDGIRLIYSQRYVPDSFLVPTDRIIREYLCRGLGLHEEDRYFYANEYVAVTDVSADGDNVLYNGTDLFFIDPIIKMKRPAAEVLSYYYGILK